MSNSIFIPFKKYTLYMVFLTILSVVSVLFSNFIVNSGINIISAHDLLSDYLFASLLGVAIWCSMFWLFDNERERHVLQNVWIIKCFVVLVVMLFYEQKYSTLDSYSYFSIPQESNFVFTGFSIGNGTENIYNLVWILFRLIPTSFHSLKIIFAFVGLLAIYIFFKTAQLYNRNNSTKLLYFLELYPSILFWSSILGKDPIVLLGISMAVYGVVGIITYSSKKYFIIFTAGVIIATSIRLWLGPVLVIPVFIIFIKSTASKALKLIVIIFSLSIMYLSSSLLVSKHGVESFHDINSQIDTQSKSFAEDGGSGQIITYDLTNPTNIIKFLPIAIFTALFRPLPGDVNNLFGIVSGIENLSLLYLLYRAIKYKPSRAVLTSPVISSAIIFILSWAAIYGFISYQNLGSAVRFKLQVLPVLLMILLYLGNVERCDNAN